MERPHSFTKDIWMHDLLLGGQQGHSSCTSMLDVCIYNCIYQIREWEIDA